MKTASIFAYVLVAISVGAIAVGCSGGGSSSGGTTSSSGGTTGGGDCTQFAATACAKIDSCAPGLLAFYYGDLAACKVGVALGCENNKSFPGSTFAASGAKCVTAYSSATCDELLGGTSAVIFDTCGKGSLTTATACIESSQCSSGYCKVTDPNSGSSCGTCAPLPVAGDACINTCGGIGLACVKSTCVKEGVVGSKCDASAPCGGVLSCDSGACAPLSGLGGACGATGPSCGLGLFCDAGKCANVPTAKLGEACGVVDGKLAQCVASHCGKPDQNGNGTCEAFGTKGDVCGATTDKQCGQPYKCVSGKCGFDDPATCK